MVLGFFEEAGRLIGHTNQQHFNLLKKPVLHFDFAREGKAKALLDTRHSKIQEMLGCRVLVENVDCVGR